MLARETGAMAKPDAGSRRRFVEEGGAGDGQHCAQMQGEEKAARREATRRRHGC